jgi:hypothetical protein
MIIQSAQAISSTRSIHLTYTWNLQKMLLIHTFHYTISSFFFFFFSYYLLYAIGIEGQMFPNLISIVYNVYDCHHLYFNHCVLLQIHECHNIPDYFTLIVKFNIIKLYKIIVAIVVQNSRLNSLRLTNFTLDLLLQRFINLLFLLLICTYYN